MARWWVVTLIPWLTRRAPGARFNDPPSAGAQCLEPGAQLGHYEILRPLGAGGMGEVYQAHDSRLQREVAVKVLRSAPQDASRRARVWREARAAARVNHPGVCQIYDVGEVGGDPFLVMELLTGRSLAARLETGPLPFEESIQVSLSALEALEALHHRQIVHRDLKPSNVFLTSQGVKLLDFGLARARDTGSELQTTAVGIVMGTPRYMAPEQWTDAPPDPRSDLFALAALMYEMLTGRPAFPGDDLRHVYHAVMSGHPPALGGSPVVAAVDAVIHHALEKQPDDRYPSAVAMAQALRAAISFGEGRLQDVVRPTTRLVVLPFRMLQPDPDLEFLSFSLADAVVSSLAGLQSLVVRAAPQGARFPVDRPDLAALAADMGVDVVVCGTLLRAGDRVRLSAQLLAVPSATVLWAGSEEAVLQHLFDMQDHLARNIVASLALPLSAREQRRLGRDLPASARAYEYYLRGNELSQDPERLPIAAQLYRSALQDDPDYAPAWANLGRVCRLLAKYGTEGATTQLETARDAFARALSIDPDLSAAHNLYTYFEVETLGQPTAAMARLLGRVQIDRTNPELFAGLVLALRYCGLLDASIAADRQARRLDPAVRTSVAFSYFMLADWARAMEHDVDEIRWVTQWCLPMLGREAEAIAAYAALGRRPVPRLMRTLATASRLALERQHDECLAAIETVAEQGFDPEGLYFAARALVRIGEHDRAITMLDRVVERGFYGWPAFLRDPWLDRLRGETRFALVVRRAQERSREAEHAFRLLEGGAVLGV